MCLTVLHSLLYCMLLVSRSCKKTPLSLNWDQIFRSSHTIHPGNTRLQTETSLWAYLHYTVVLNGCEATEWTNLVHRQKTPGKILKSTQEVVPTILKWWHTRKNKERETDSQLENNKHPSQRFDHNLICPSQRCQVIQQTQSTGLFFGLYAQSLKPFWLIKCKSKNVCWFSAIQRENRSCFHLWHIPLHWP